MSSRCPADFAFRAFAGYRLMAIHLQQGLPTGKYTRSPQQAGSYEVAIRDLPCRPRLFRNPRHRTGPVGDHPREHRGPLSLGQIHASHEDHSAGEQLDSIGRNRIAFYAAMDAQFASHSDWLPCTPSAPVKGLDSPPTTSSKWWSRDIW